MLDRSLRWSMATYRLWTSGVRMSRFRPGVQCVQPFGQTVQVWPRLRKRTAPIHGPDGHDHAIGIEDGVDSDQGEPDDPDDHPDDVDHRDDSDNQDVLNIELNNVSLTRLCLKGFLFNFLKASEPAHGQGFSPL